MPCYTVITSSVEFKIGNIDLLKKALEKLGIRINKQYASEAYLSFYHSGNYITIDLRKGKITSEMNEKKLSEFSNQIKRAYSSVVVDEVAKRQKWIRKNTAENKGQLQRY